jgi:hypothetical protein
MSIIVILVLAVSSFSDIALFNLIIITGFTKTTIKLSVITFKTGNFGQCWFSRDGHIGLELIFINANV